MKPKTHSTLLELATVRSKAVVLFLLIHCVIFAAVFCGGFAFCLSFVVVYALSMFAVTSPALCSAYLARLVCSVRVCVCVMVVFSGHIHLLFHDNTGCVFTINVPQYL